MDNTSLASLSVSAALERGRARAHAWTRHENPVTSGSHHCGHKGPTAANLGRLDAQRTGAGRGRANRTDSEQGRRVTCGDERSWRPSPQLRTRAPGPDRTGPRAERPTLLEVPPAENEWTRLSPMLAQLPEDKIATMHPCIVARPRTNVGGGMEGRWKVNRSTSRFSY